MRRPGGSTTRDGVSPRSCPPEAVSRADHENVDGLRKPDAPTSFLACSESYGVRRTLVASCCSVRRRDRGAADLYEPVEEDLPEDLTQLRARGQRRTHVRVRQVAEAAVVAHVVEDSRPAAARSNMRRLEVCRCADDAVVGGPEARWWSVACLVRRGRIRTEHGLIRLEIATDRVLAPRTGSGLADGL